MIKESEVMVSGENILKPFKNREYELHPVTTKDGKIKINLRIRDKEETIVW